MACFIAPVAEAVVVTAATKIVKKKEKKNSGIPFSRKLKWLTNMLWGGSALLAFEHLWHGEIVPFFPFLTAMSNPADMREMLLEVATTGALMSALVTVVWIGMIAAVGYAEKGKAKMKAVRRSAQ